VRQEKNQLSFQTRLFLSGLATAENVDTHMKTFKKNIQILYAFLAKMVPVVKHERVNTTNYLNWQDVNARKYKHREQTLHAQQRIRQKRQTIVSSIRHNLTEEKDSPSRP
jgi:bifunctional pyridoxal-dependent enzyme with beta-cystathionase and maltose regulon repressor activities